MASEMKRLDLLGDLQEEAFGQTCSSSTHNKRMIYVFRDVQVCNGSMTASPLISGTVEALPLFSFSRRVPFVASGPRPRRAAALSDSLPIFLGVSSPLPDEFGIQPPMDQRFPPARNSHLFHRSAGGVVALY